MNRTERDELRRSIIRFQELSMPHKLLELIRQVEQAERVLAGDQADADEQNEATQPRGAH